MKSTPIGGGCLVCGRPVPWRPNYGGSVDPGPPSTAYQWPVLGLVAGRQCMACRMVAERDHRLGVVVYARLADERSGFAAAMAAGQDDDPGSWDPVTGDPTPPPVAALRGGVRFTWAWHVAHGLADADDPPAEPFGHLTWDGDLPVPPVVAA